MLERMGVLQAREKIVEQELRIHFPSICNGDWPFAEVETLNFERRYQMRGEFSRGFPCVI